MGDELGPGGQGRPGERPQVGRGTHPPEGGGVAGGAGPAPLLAGLRLSADEYRALARQGFVAREYRGGAGPYYKLQFRSGGRQAVRYLGKDPERARAVALELEALQAPGRLRRQLRDLAAQARRALRRSKQEAEGPLRERGYYFHGNTVRRRLARTAEAVARATSPPPLAPPG